MRIPKPGPKVADLYALLSGDDKLFAKMNARKVTGLVSRANQEAWNWEDCSRHAGLAELTSKQFWLLVKISRDSDRVATPLCDKRQRPFSFRLPPVAHRLLPGIDLHLGGSLGTPIPGVASEDQQKRYLMTSLREEAIASSLIEGAVVTRQEAREMIRTKRVPKSKHEQMVLNNFQTIRVLNQQRFQPMTPALLCEVQMLLTKETLDDPDAGGRFRRADEEITVYDEEVGEPLYFPPPAEALPKRFQLFCDFANASHDASPFVHPAVRAIILHFWLGYDHPFVDGNGRTARAVFYWSMLKSGYWLTEFISVSSVIQKQVKHYYRAYFNSEIDDNDLTYFILYHLDVIDRGIKEFKAYLDEKMSRRQQFPYLERSPFNVRQQALLQRALRDPLTRFTYQSHAQSHDVTLPTARADMLDLVQSKLLILNRRGRAFAFTAVANLEARLLKLSRRAT